MDIINHNWNKEVQTNPWVREILHNYPKDRYWVAMAGEHLDGQDVNASGPLIRYFNEGGYPKTMYDVTTERNYKEFLERRYDAPEDEEFIVRLVTPGTENIARTFFPTIPQGFTRSEKSKWHNLTKLNLPLYNLRSTKTPMTLHPGNHIPRWKIDRQYMDGVNTTLKVSNVSRWARRDRLGKIRRRLDGRLDAGDLPGENAKFSAGIDLHNKKVLPWD